MFSDSSRVKHRPNGPRMPPSQIPFQLNSRPANVVRGRMKKSHGFTMAVAALFWFASPAARGAEGVLQFNRDIRPILSDHCFQCHGPDAKKRKADLRLDTRAGLFEEREGIHAVRPGQPPASELIRRVTAADPADLMPPPEAKVPLTSEEIGLLAQWIEQGAPWQDHWAFVTPETPDLPAVKNQRWPVNPIDLFILARLEKEGLAPNHQADRRTLIRRVTLDLTGLPPTPSEVEEFLRDTTPNAYAKVVDRLLASERYGERMALAWMDAARYGDSSVYHADGLRDMWPWRDWVIRAYNRNMPFDQFTVEQLAGDHLPGRTIQQRVATGFNRNHGTTDEGGAIDEEYRVEYIVDRVKTTANVWLGLTMECGQCHDHKYDPISQKEYYQFYAYFNRSQDRGMQTRGGNAEPLVYVYNPDQEVRAADLRDRITEMQQLHREKRPRSREVLAWVSELRENPEPEPPEMAPWLKLGPFRAADANEAFNKDFGPEGELDLTKTYDKHQWEIQKDWKDGEVVALGLPDNAAVYLHRRLIAAKAGSFDVSLGSDDGIQVWLNGASLLSNQVARPAAADQEKVTLSLLAGDNDFLMKIQNGGGGSGFYFKLLGSSIPKEIRESIARAESEWTEDERSKVTDYYAKTIWPEGLRRLEAINGLKVEEKALQESVATCMVMEDMPDPRKTYVLARGHYASPIQEEETYPGVPAALPSLPANSPPNRLTLARWLVDPSHPLTPRVAVNRYWQMFFGEGLVATVSDFGTRGAWPSHPELLDWLARDFADHGWDVKRAIKQMVMSATYRQSYRITPEKLTLDPGNRLLSRAPRLRLQGEFIRDTALAVAGLLNERVGGPSVKPYQPTNIWNEVSLDGNLRYQRDDGEKLYRRGMYIYWKRSAPSPSMMAFDAPTREKCVVQRQRTNTPLQALVTLNDVQFVEAARLYARRVLEEGGLTFEEKLNYAFRLAVAREADTVRQQALRRLYERQRKYYAQHPDEAESLLRFGDYPAAPEMNAVEWAAWTTVTGAILNLDEFLTRE